MTFEEAVSTNPLTTNVAVTALCAVAYLVLAGMTYVLLHVLRIPRLLPLGYERHIQPSFKFPDIVFGSLMFGTVMSWCFWFVPCHNFLPDIRLWWSGVGIVWLVAIVALVIGWALFGRRTR